LKNRFVALMVLGIFLIVGIDVGVNAVSGQFLLEKFNSTQIFAESGRSVYFFGKMLGTFVGALLLARISSHKFFLWTSVLGLLAISLLFVIPNEMLAMIVIFIIGLGVANIFPLIFSLTVEKYPERANEISGLMIMAVSGGAVIPLIMGWISDWASVNHSMLVLLVSVIVILLLSINKSRATS